MDISLMTTLMPTAAGTSEEKLAAPDMALFEGELMEQMAPPPNLPPGVQAPPPPLLGVEGATRTEADAQPNADDQTLDQPQDANLLAALTATMLWQAVAPTAPTEIPQAAAVTEAMVVDATATPAEIEGKIKAEGDPNSDDQEVEPSEALIEAEPTSLEFSTLAVSRTASVNEEAAFEKVDAAMAAEEPKEVEVESIEVETSRPVETPKPAHEQIQFKPHSLDRPLRTLEAVREARQPVQMEGSIRAAVVKMELVSETFGNLNVSIKSLGQSVEADIRTQNHDLNQALHTHRPDLVQSVESKGLTLSQFDVRQQNHHQNPQQGQPQNQNEQPATKEDLERMARLNFGPVVPTAATFKPTLGLVNTLA